MNIKHNVKQFGRKHGLAASLAVALIGVVGMTTADAATGRDAALPADSVTGPVQVKDGTLYCADFAVGLCDWMLTTPSGSIHESSLDAALKVKVNQIGSGPQGPAGPAGPAGAQGAQGPKGDKGDSAIVTVSAATALTNRPDSGTAGTWANDTLSRNVSVTKHGAVDAAKCGPTATECYLYYVSGTDTGTFATVPGWKTPGAGANGAGNVSGSVSGAFKGQFYATSATPDPSLVDATVNGAAHPTAQWAAMFFPATVTVTDTELRDWGWTYKAPEFCNTWVNAKAGNTGDITGVNAC